MVIDPILTLLGLFAAEEVVWLARLVATETMSQNCVAAEGLAMVYLFIVSLSSH